jgi:hypothetical protein
VKDRLPKAAGHQGENLDVQVVLRPEAEWTTHQLEKLVAQRVAGQSTERWDDIVRQLSKQRWNVSEARYVSRRASPSTLSTEGPQRILDVLKVCQPSHVTVSSKPHKAWQRCELGYPVYHGFHGISRGVSIIHSAVANPDFHLDTLTIDGRIPCAVGKDGSYGDFLFTHWDAEKLVFRYVCPSSEHRCQQDNIAKLLLGRKAGLTKMLLRPHPSGRRRCLILSVDKREDVECFRAVFEHGLARQTNEKDVQFNTKLQKMCYWVWENGDKSQGPRPIWSSSKDRREPAKEHRTR